MNSVRNCSKASKRHRILLVNFPLHVNDNPVHANVPKQKLCSNEVFDTTEEESGLETWPEGEAKALNTDGDKKNILTKA